MARNTVLVAAYEWCALLTSSAALCHCVKADANLRRFNVNAIFAQRIGSVRYGPEFIEVLGYEKKSEKKVRAGYLYNKFTSSPEGILSEAFRGAEIR